jgi:glycosyltransferase involved in cell wall biosynthesis
MKNEDLLISIVTPYYKVKEYILRLANDLEPQLNNKIEWIIIDDGCNEKRLDELKAKVIHLPINSGGASIPRNVGLNEAKGKYICFIDADDRISNDYIETIIEKTKENWDYCYISWAGKSNTIIIENEPPKWNCCVWNCIYKRDLIGNERFKPELKMAEDLDFNKRVRKGKRANITKIIYYYNEDTPNSLTKQGELYNSKYKGDDNNAIQE